MLLLNYILRGVDVSFICKEEDIAMNVSRFNFAGFSLVRTADTTTHEVEIGKVTMGEDSFIVHMVRKAGLSFEGNFLLSKIYNATETVEHWNFKNSRHDGLGMLARAGDELVIAFVGKGRNGEVNDVVSFASITDHKPISIERKLELKHRAAEFLGRKYSLSKVENTLHQRMLAKMREAEASAREAAAAARAEAREELRRAVAGRGKITVYTASGQQRYGYPVLENEWPSLDKSTFVVLCDSIGVDGATLKVLEAFQVVKDHGKNPTKGNPAPVSLDRPKMTALASAELPKPVGTIAVSTDNGTFEVAVYATMDDIRLARAGGLNSGSYVAALDHRKDDGRYEVLSVRKDSVSTVGLHEAI